MLKLPVMLGVAPADIGDGLHWKALAVPRARTGQVAVQEETAAGEKIEEN